MLIYKDSEGNKQEQYFYATANNQKSWVENFDDYSNHDYHNAAQSDADFAEKAGPYAKGAALLSSPISLYNRGKTLVTGEDLYGNNAEGTDYMLSIIDFATFGVGELNVPKIIENINGAIGYINSWFSMYRTIRNENNKQKGK